MAYIEKRKLKDGTFSYRVRIRQKGSPDVTQSFPTRTEAIKWSQRMEADVRAGRYFGREEAKERTFAEFINTYIDKELPKKKDIRKQRMQLLWWKNQLGKYFLCHITPAMIAEKQEFLSSEIIDKKGTPRSNSTTNRYMAALSSAYSTCIREWHWVKENPVLKIKKLKENKGRERYLEIHEITRLLDACKKSKSSHIYAVTLFALCCGARKGEILGLKYKNLDLKRRTATFEATKNGETRTVHLSDTVVDCLTKEISQRTVLSEYVFPSKDGTKPADIKGGWENAVKDAGLSGVCFHTLRHTAASHLAMKGISLSLIGKILGHKSYSQTLRYSHLSTSSTASALNQLTDELVGAFASG